MSRYFPLCVAFWILAATTTQVLRATTAFKATDEWCRQHIGQIDTFEVLRRQIEEKFYPDEAVTKNGIPQAATVLVRTLATLKFFIDHGRVPQTALNEEVMWVGPEERAYTSMKPHRDAFLYILAQPQFRELFSARFPEYANKYNVKAKTLRLIAELHGGKFPILIRVLDSLKENPGNFAAKHDRYASKQIMNPSNNYKALFSNPKVMDYFVPDLFDSLSTLEEAQLRWKIQQLIKQLPNPTR